MRNIFGVRYHRAQEELSSGSPIPSSETDRSAVADSEDIHYEESESPSPRTDLLSEESDSSDRDGEADQTPAKMALPP